jgi:hypothetical protein
MITTPPVSGEPGQAPDRVAALRGYLAVLRCDNGSELAAPRWPTGPDARATDDACPGGDEMDKSGCNFIPPGEPLAQWATSSRPTPAPRRVPEYQHLVLA